VLAAAPVPEGSLIPISEITASAAQARGDADGKNTPRVALRFTCGDPRIPCRRRGGVGDGSGDAYEARVCLGVSSYGSGRNFAGLSVPGEAKVCFLFPGRLQVGSQRLYSYDACPVVTGLGGDVVPTGGRLRRGSDAPRQAGEFCPGEPPPALRDHGAALACAGRGRGNRTLARTRAPCGRSPAAPARKNF